VRLYISTSWSRASHLASKAPYTSPLAFTFSPSRCLSNSLSRSLLYYHLIHGPAHLRRTQLSHWKPNLVPQLVLINRHQPRLNTSVVEDPYPVLEYHRFHGQNRHSPLIHHLEVRSEDGCLLRVDRLSSLPPIIRSHLKDFWILQVNTSMWRACHKLLKRMMKFLVSHTRFSRFSDAANNATLCLCYRQTWIQRVRGLLAFILVGRAHCKRTPRMRLLVYAIYISLFQHSHLYHFQRSSRIRFNATHVLSPSPSPSPALLPLSSPPSNHPHNPQRQCSFQCTALASAPISNPKSTSQHPNVVALPKPFFQQR
jgi:hypothetical protein